MSADKHEHLLRGGTGNDVVLTAVTGLPIGTVTSAAIINGNLVISDVSAGGKNDNSESASDRNELHHSGHFQSDSKPNRVYQASMGRPATGPARSSSRQQLFLGDAGQTLRAATTRSPSIQPGTSLTRSPTTVARKPPAIRSPSRAEPLQRHAWLLPAPAPAALPSPATRSSVTTAWSGHRQS